MLDRLISSVERDLCEGKPLIIDRKFFDQFVRINDVCAFAYCNFRIYNSDIIASYDCIEECIIKGSLEYTDKYFTDNAADWENKIRFTVGDEEPVFTSKLYERFVEKQRKALANYFEIEEDQLSDAYEFLLRISEGEIYGDVQLDKSTFGRIVSSIIHIIWLHGGAGQWLINIQSKNKANPYAYDYRPDFNMLFEKLCRSEVIIAYQICMENGEPFAPLTLSRDCAFDNMEELAVSMGYMYVSDCIYQLFFQMQKQYYEDFSWEQYRKRDLKEYYGNPRNRGVGIHL